MTCKYGLLLLFSAVLLGCDKFEQLGSPPKQVVVKVNSLANIKEVEQILYKRFSEHKVSIFTLSRLFCHVYSRIDSSIDGDTITYTFKWDSPSKDKVDYLIKHKGNLVVRASVGYIWFTSRDINHSSVKKEEDRNYLIFGVQDSAVPKIRRLSRKNIGKEMRMELDGELISRAVIKDELGKWFLVDLEKEYDELSLISTLLETGPLPEELVIVRN